MKKSGDSYEKDSIANLSGKGTRFNLAYVYAKQKRYREAIAEMQKAVRLKPNDEQAQSRLCNFYLLAKDRQSALAQIRTVKSMNPELTQTKQNTKLKKNFGVLASRTGVEPVSPP